MVNELEYKPMIYRYVVPNGDDEICCSSSTWTCLIGLGDLARSLRAKQYSNGNNEVGEEQKYKREKR